MNWRRRSGWSVRSAAAALAALALAALALAALLAGCGSPRQWTEPTTGMRLVRLPAGSFMMGSPATELGREAEETPHPVRVRAFDLGVTEVTQGQWRRVMGSNPSWFATCGDDCPVEKVSWNDVQVFLGKLRASTGKPFRLPTEAEWEYACRAGTSTPFSTGESLTTAQANYDGEGPYAGAPPGEFRRRTTPVASFAPNGFGLYDMHGNVWEWTSDWHCPYPVGDDSGAAGKCQTEYKVIRGGSFYFDASSARCALRYTHRPQDSGLSVGFRVAVGE
jgi:formylglycine-generating enzyme required for sulfatase activity